MAPTDVPPEDLEKRATARTRRSGQTVAETIGERPYAFACFFVIVVLAGVAMGAWVTRQAYTAVARSPSDGGVLETFASVAEGEEARKKPKPRPPKEPKPKPAPDDPPPERPRPDPQVNERQGDQQAVEQFFWIVPPPPAGLPQFSPYDRNE